MDGAVLVDGRNAARRHTALGMRCDAKEIPDSLDDAKPTGWWIATAGTFEGKAHAGGESDTVGEPQAVNSAGTVAMVVVNGRLLGIVSPNTTTQEAIWFATPVSALRTETSGSQGLFKKRPGEICLTGDGWLVKLTQVNRLYRNSNRFQSGQEGSFLAALGN